MTLYEINQAIAECLITDLETGEVTFDEARFGELEMLRQDKLENIACWIKNLASDAKAISEEVESMNARKKQLENTQERLENLLKTTLAGEKLTTPKVAVTYRKSKETIIDQKESLPVEFLKIVTDVDKAAIRSALLSGLDVPGAHLEEKMNMSIK